ncbi:MAG: TatD family hydrolase [Holosporaceae bacterium]|jgi:TatD DNase family protein|nr:TatD family hydrolase [Holosporaceae bacterium]
MFFVDSHFHPVYSRFKDLFKTKDDFESVYGVDAIVKRATDANVGCMLAIGVELNDIPELQAVTEAHPQVFRTVAVHALEAAKHCEQYTTDEISEILENACSHAKTVGVGEIGLDYHYEKESRKQQDLLFNLQLNLAREQNLPVVIHSREAIDDTVAILKNHSGVRGVIHCFSGEKHFAEKVLDLGFFISITGAVTFKKNTELQETVKYVPRDRLLIETDSPFLAPIPFRGNWNEPSFVVYVARKIAELLNVSEEEVARFSTENFLQLFSKINL